METPTSPDLGQAKVENAHKAVEQALDELREAQTDEAVEQALDELREAQTDEAVELWANRLKQRKADLRRLKEETLEVAA